MTVTNDERREVAARLRSVNGAPEWATTACCIAECLGEHDYPLWNDSKPLFNRLADLIEPEPERTCKVLKEIVDLDGTHMTDYSCGCCNNEGWNKNYCSNCGAKIVD